MNNFLTNQTTCFMENITFKTNLSDHHKLTENVPKSEFAKGEPN